MIEYEIKEAEKLEVLQFRLTRHAKLTIAETHDVTSARRKQLEKFMNTLRTI
jgi:hypothetical protein